MDENIKPDYVEGHRLYSAGLSMAQVGEHLGVSAAAVHKAFKKLKLPVRGPSYQLPEGFESKLLKTG